MFLFYFFVDDVKVLEECFSVDLRVKKICLISSLYALRTRSQKYTKVGEQSAEQSNQGEDSFEKMRHGCPRLMRDIP